MNESLNIALADDDALVRSEISSQLSALGHQVKELPNGAELIRHCVQVEPDLIICDVQMPFLDGPTAVRSIRRRRDTPVIFISGQPFIPEFWPDAIFLPKPIYTSQLQSALEAAVNRSILAQAG